MFVLVNDFEYKSCRQFLVAHFCQSKFIQIFAEGLSRQVLDPS